MFDLDEFICIDDCKDSAEVSCEDYSLSISTWSPPGAGWATRWVGGAMNWTIGPEDCHTANGRYERARYGLRARRIGEASHPGPAASSCTFLQGSNLVTGAGWNGQAVTTPRGARGSVASSSREPIEASNSYAGPPQLPARVPRRLWQCPLCNHSVSGEMRMLLIHVSVQHSGEPIGPPARAIFANMGRGMCCTEGCGALRALDAPRCRKCRRNAAVRPLVQFLQARAAFAAACGPRS